MTAREQQEWYVNAAKGAYNYSDLNRVETAVSELSEFYNLGLVTKTDWTKWDTPTQADMTRYLSNIGVIRSMCFANLTLPPLPATMDHLTYRVANDLEEILGIAYQIADSTPRAGEIFTGEV